MAFNNTQQTIQLIKASKNILICFKEDWSGDALASSLVLKRVASKIGKQADIVCYDFKPKDNLSFLPQSEVKNKFENLNKFIIKINTANTQVGEFDYDHEDDNLNIYLTPTNGNFSKEDITTATSDYKYDLIITLNSPDLESLGKLYEKNSAFFFNTPKINIDHSDRNEHFGDVNLINLINPATSEVIYDLIKEIDEGLIDDDIATYLLAGIITATKNFKTANIPPKTLSTASELVTMGGRREQIIKNLYQNRYLKTLKLWGRVLSRLDNDLDDKLVWSTITKNDFLETATAPEEIEDVIEELIATMPKTEMICLIYEDRDRTECIVYSTKNLDSKKICKGFFPQGNSELVRFGFDGNNASGVEMLVIGEIKTQLEKPTDLR